MARPTVSSPTECGVPATRTTSSVDRRFSDLDGILYLSWIFVFSILRAVVFHPFVLVLTAKQTGLVHESVPTLRALSELARSAQFGGSYLRALSPGLAASILGLCVSECVNMGLLEYLRQMLPMPQESLRDGVGAYMSDAASHFFDIPVQVVATLQMAKAFRPPVDAAVEHQKGGVNVVHHHHHHHGEPGGAAKWAAPVPKMDFFTVGRSVFKERGVRGLWAGYGTTLVMGSSWGGLWWLGYLRSKEVFYAGALRVASSSSRVSSSSPGDVNHSSTSLLSDVKLAAVPGFLRPCFSLTDNPLIHVAASVVTSATTTAMFNPFSVIRTRLQCAAGASALSLRQVVRDVYRDHGMWGFWLGTRLNVGTNVVDGILIAQTYESARLLSDHHS